MKRRKGIGLLERHFDKLLVAALLLAFMGVTAQQLTSGPGTIRVGSTEDVPLDRAYERLAQEAEQLRVQLEEPTVDRRAPSPPAPLAPIITHALRGDRTPETLATLTGLPNAPAGTGGPLEPGPQGPAIARLALGVPVLPAPTSPLANVAMGAMDPFEPARHSAIVAADIIPPDQPYDFRAATIQASFDAGELMQVIRADPDGAGPLEPAPENWWRTRLAILDVEVQRQRTNAPAGEPILVPPAPGRASFRDRISAEITPEALDALVNEARRGAKTLLHPAFYNMIAGGPWRLPRDAVEFAAKRDRVEQLVSQRRNILREIQELRQARAAALAQPGQPPGRGGGGRSSDERERERAAAEARAQRLEELQNRLRRVERDLEEMGFSPEGEPLNNPTAQTLAAPAPALTDAAPFTFWAIDPYVEAGQSYRYRIRLILANPLYGREAGLAEEAQEHARSPVIATPWSQWTEQPVSVDRDAYLFITRAGPGALGGAESATAELYRYYYGAWRRVVKRVEEGDLLEQSTPVSALTSTPLPRFEVEIGPEGQPAVAGSTPIETSLRFKQGGAFVTAIVPSPDVGRGRDERYDVVIRSVDAPNLEVRSPQVESADARRRRLIAAAEAAVDMKVRRPGVDENKPAERERGAPGAPLGPVNAPRGS